MKGATCILGDFAEYEKSGQAFDERLGDRYRGFSISQSAWRLLGKSNRLSIVDQAERKGYTVSNPYLSDGGPVKFLLKGPVNDVPIHPDPTLAASADE